MGVVERDAVVMCPFCSYFYDHDELVDLNTEVANGTIGKDEALARLAEFHTRVLAAPGNASPQREGAELDG